MSEFSAPGPVDRLAQMTSRIAPTSPAATAADACAACRSPSSRPPGLWPAQPSRIRLKQPDLYREARRKPAAWSRWRARWRYNVALPTFGSAAISLIAISPLSRMANAALSLRALSMLGEPPIRPRSRSNSARAANRCSCSRSAAVLVSMLSCKERNAIPRPSSSAVASRCFRFRPRRIQPPDDQRVAGHS